MKNNSLLCVLSCINCYKLLMINNLNHNDASSGMIIKMNCNLSNEICL